MPVNKSEEFVFKICQGTFLSLWSYANPLRKDRCRELCDILVVCHPHVVILSVKERSPAQSGDINTDWDRWTKQAVEGSRKQIYGAERELQQMTHVVKADRSEGLPLPPVNERRIHRVAVALGSNGEVPIASGDHGKGFVHVFEEVAFTTLLCELDTITDFLGFLETKEQWILRGRRVVTFGEEDLLALYLGNGRSFPEQATMLHLDEDLWKAFSSRPEFLAKKEADHVSYVWDRLIEYVSGDVLATTAQTEGQIGSSELALRVLARESRFSRRTLAQALTKFLIHAQEQKVRSSMIVQSPSGIFYVFLTTLPSVTRAERIDELTIRCFVARGKFQNTMTVIGIATEVPGLSDLSDLSSVDVLLYEKPEWTEEDQKNFEFIQRTDGPFSQSRMKLVHEEEYPTQKGREKR
jgi:hypothetical protein